MEASRSSSATSRERLDGNNWDIGAEIWLWKYIVI